tara:strand:+ start:240 stop:536 length:297 start_codon:yes stop_codon:yes gene_type:complete
VEDKMSIENKIIKEWEARTPVGYGPLYTRATEGPEEEVAATVIQGDDKWGWVITSDAKEAASGREVSSELARFKADLKLSELVSDPSNIQKIFVLKEE